MTAASYTREQLFFKLLPLIVATLIFFVALNILNPVTVAIMCAGVLLGLGITIVPPQKTILIYFAYLMFEGSLKVLSGYHPIVHIGSDLLLILAFLRIVNDRQHAIPSIDQKKLHRRIYAVTSFIVVFWLWCGIQFFNPLGLGILPSLAAAKLYVVPILVFFMVCNYLDAQTLRQIPKLLIFMGLAQTALSIVDWHLGSGFVSSLHGGYASAVSSSFTGPYYRPFGTTAVPGGPSAWVTNCFIGCVFYLYLEKAKVKEFLTQRKVMGGAFVALGVATLLICQERALLLRFCGLLFLSLFLLGPKSAILSTIGLGAAGIIAATLLSPVQKDDFTPYPESKTAQVQQRLTALGNIETWTESRQHTIRKMIQLSSRALFGIGLSRTGAASAVWKDRITENPYFGISWAFSDNVYRALFIELGVFGLLAFVTLHAAVIWQLLSVRHYLANFVAGSCVIMLVAGFASEGILYQPDASFYWLFCGLGLRIPALEGIAA